MANCVKCGRKLPPFTFGKKMCKWCVGYYAAQNGEAAQDELQPVMPLPWVRARTGPTVTMALVGLNVLIFVAMAMRGVPIMDPSSADLIHWGANCSRTLDGEWWRLLTNTFVHIGVIHIALNMWCLWSLGALAESLYGSETFAAVYLVSGVGGSLFSLWWHPNIVSAGASGAIFGVAGALIASLRLGEFALPRAAISGTLRSVVTFAGYNLLFGMRGGVDNAAHIGGFLTGLVLGALIARVAPDRHEPVRRITVVAFVMVLLFGAGAWLWQAHAHVVHAERGSALIEHGNKEQAILDLQSAVRLRPDYLAARYDLARAYSLSGRFAEAETELKTILQREPQDAATLYLLGVVYLESGKPSAARETFIKALASNPDDSDIHAGLGRTWAAEGRHQTAIEEYKKAIELDPKSGYAYYYLGLSYTNSARYDEAVSALRKSQELSGDDSDIETALAAAYHGLGKLQEAEEARQKAKQMGNEE